MGGRLPSVETVLSEAIGINSAAERSDYLDSACGSDVALRRQVESLLGAHIRAGDFLEVPAASPTVTFGTPPAEGPGTSVGPYKLLEEIGEGGMGVVYMAEQTHPIRRRVALKVIKPGMDSRQVIARFEAERQALAMMDHPNIARVHDAGTTQAGRPYFVMELVRGLPITDYCDREKLPVPERLELFVLVCRAVQHAHQKGIIHRDLKPSNVLVTVLDGVPVPKVIDFGIAKATGASLTERTLFTGFHQLVGTPLYMSPEQADLSSADVDTRSDIYSLGVLLYELLTGSTPFDGETLRKAAFDEMRRIIREDEPPKPSTRLSDLGESLSTVSAHRGSDPRRLDRSVRGELDWIAMKALEKDRRRRYETANDFASDVMRYLTDQPVEACPPSTGYRFRKYVLRNRMAFVTTALVATAMSLGTAASIWQAMRATRAEQKALSEWRKAEASDKAARAQANKAKVINDFLIEDFLLQAEPSSNAVEDQVTLLETVDRAADKVGVRFRDQPEVESALRLTLSGIYHGLGSFAKAESQAQLSLEIAERLHGREAARSFFTLGHLAHIRHHLGRSRESIELLERACEGLRRTLGPDHPDTLTDQGHLATAYLATGRIPEAIRLFESTLKLRESKFGREDPDTLTAAANLAGAYLDAGRITEAVALHESTLKLREAKLGPDHPDTLTNRSNLAGAYSHSGRGDEAIQLLESVIKLQEAKLGPDHPSTLASRNDLALAYREAGRGDEAIRLHESTLKLSEAKLGPDHPHTLTSRNNLALAYQNAGRFTDAIQLHESTLKLQEARLGPDHPSTLASRSNLGEAYREAGRTDEAIRLNTSTLKLKEAKLGPDHPDTLASRNNLALAYQQAGRVDEAIRLYESMTKRNESVFGPDHPNTFSARHNLAQAYLKVGRVTEGIALHTTTLELEETKLGPDHPYTLDSVHALAHASGFERPAEVETLFRRALEGYRKLQGPDGPMTIDLTRDLGGLLDRTGRAAEAEAYWRESLDRQRTRSRVDIPDLSRPLAELGLHLMNREMWAEAEPILRECLTIRKKASPNDWTRFNTLSMLGGALLGRREFAEAEPLLLQGYEGLKRRESKIPASARARLSQAAERVVALYVAWGKPEEADRWRARLGQLPAHLPADVFAK